MIQARIRIAFLFTLIFTTTYAQEPVGGANVENDNPSEPKHKKTWVGLRGGVALPDFYKRSKDAVRPPVLDNPLVGFQGGISVEMAHSRWYGARVEVSYVRKGAREVFFEPGTILESTTKLDYIQAVAMPVILKLGVRKVQPFIGLGGYAGYAVRVDHSLLINRKAGASTTNMGDNLNKLDYGCALSVGCYLGRHPIELRYEAGLAQLFQESTIASSARNQSVSFHFSL